MPLFFFLFKRFLALFPDKPKPDDVLKVSVEKLRSVGFSNPKANYVRNIAQAITSGALLLDQFEKMTDDEVKSELLKIKGIGPWSAEMFLIFSLKRPDVFSVGDLGLRTAIERLYGISRDDKKAILALKWAVKEMERRYTVLEAAGARDVHSYHEEAAKDAETMPYIVVIIDELADLMQTYPRELEAAVVRLAQMSRAVGIHLMLSTQRPSVNIITGLIKANIPARIALQVSSQIDSRTILDTSGAEKLLGAGDMLFMSGEMSKPKRIQSAYISEKEVKGVAKYLKDNYADELQEIRQYRPSAFLALPQEGNHEGHEGHGG